MRKKLIAGNWKMHKTVPEAQTLARQLADRLSDVNFADVAICPPFVDLYPVSLILREKESKIILGAQNMHPEPKGAFTGEISAEMLLSAGAKMVILGHSERRHIFGETDGFINAKVRRALEVGLVPILCIGETLEQRKAGKTNDVLREQITKSLAGVQIDDPHKIIIAYEPVWAIGTGVNATPEQAQEAHTFVRGLLAQLWGEQVAQEVRILYGGSVKPANAQSLLTQPDVDGALVGGASLDADSFEGIIRSGF
ncbi:MAG TPA: triose-phosphate isomerase [candidate division Zixibacteria bacterium]|nr:triose-phosphate isomerase [candidate division Zixibacteria bacterium]